MPERTRNAYLDELDAVLPFGLERRAEIVEEISAHLDDAVADGLSEAAAQRRLGEPIELARQLARPEQSTWRVFAGVGLAVRSGVAHGLYGYFLGALIILFLTLAAAAIVQLIAALMGSRWSLMTSDQGWSTVMLALAIGVGFYYAGRVMPDRLARASHRLAIDVRPWTAGIAAGLCFVFTFFVLDLPQNWASAVALAAAPCAVVLGAYRPTLAPSGLRAYAGLVVLGLAVPAALVGATVAMTGGDLDDMPDGAPDLNVSHIGPWWPESSWAGGTLTIQSGGWGQIDHGPVEWSATVMGGTLREIRDLRLEAWHTREQAVSVDPGYDRPFATSVPARDGARLTAKIDTTHTPGVSGWILVLTGVGPDGVRYVLDAGDGGNSTFHGSVWDWIVAVAGQR